jgi:hypothetical protein
VHRPISLTPSRRQTLGLALLSMAGLRQAAGTEAKSKNNKKRKRKEKCDRKVERAVADRCGQQIDFCIANVAPSCEDFDDPPACRAALIECCDLLGQCDLPAYATCLEAAVALLD